MGKINRSIGMGTKIGANLLRTLNGHRQSVYCLSKVNSEMVVSSGGDGLIVVWHPLRTNDGIAIATADEPIYSLLALSEDHIIAGGQSGNLYQINNGHVRKIAAHTKGIFRIIQMEDGVISIGGDGCLKLWNKDLECLRTVQIGKDSLRSIAVFNAGIGVGSSDGNLYLFNREFQLVEYVKLHESTVFALAYCESLQRFLSGGRDAQMGSYNPLTGVIGEKIPAHLLHVHDVQLSPSNGLLASASMDKTIKIWNPQNMELLKVLNAAKFGAHLNSVNALTWLSESLLVSSSDDRTLCAWELA